MKKCPKCKLQKPVLEFHKNISKRDGYSSLCKECAKTSRRVSRNQPGVKERLKLYWKAYRKNNIEKIKLKNEKYLRENPEKRRDTVRRCNRKRAALKSAYMSLRHYKKTYGPIHGPEEHEFQQIINKAKGVLNEQK